MAMAMVAGLHVSAVHQMLSFPSSRGVSFNAERGDSQEGRTTPTRGDQTSRGLPRGRLRGRKTCSTPLRGDKTSRGSLGPEPTGSTWASERSEQRQAQRGALSQEPEGTDPKAGIFVLFSAVGGSMSEIVVLPGHRLRGVGGPG